MTAGVDWNMIKVEEEVYRQITCGQQGHRGVVNVPAMENQASASLFLNNTMSKKSTGA